MTKSRRKRSSNSQGGARYAALAILAVIALTVGAFLVFKNDSPVAPERTTKNIIKPPVIVPPEQQIPAREMQVPYQARSSAKKYPTGAKVLPDTNQVGTAGADIRQLAVIIDDMGSSLHEARSLAGIGVPLTFSIIPGLKNYREVASFAAANGIETMIHIPMQSKGWPERRLESNGLLVSMTSADISARVGEYMRTLPGAVGANNHMGSEFTEHEDKMRAVLEALKEKGLFFIDSVTSSETAGIRLSKEMGVKSGRRNVFLDNEQNDAYIRGQINQAVQLARRTGRAIAICHPHPATIQTLAAVLPGLQKQGITIVSASELVR